MARLFRGLVATSSLILVSSAALADSDWKKHTVKVKGTIISSRFLGTQLDWNGKKYYDGGYEVKSENGTNEAQHVILKVRYDYRDGQSQKTATKTDEKDVGVNSTEVVNSQNASIISGTIYDGTTKIGDL